MTDAARSGCRLAALPDSTADGVRTAVNQVLASAGIAPALATTAIQVNGQTADLSTARKGDQIAVRVSVPANAVGWIRPRFFSTSSVVAETQVMVRQL